MRITHFGFWARKSQSQQEATIESVKAVFLSSRQSVQAEAPLGAPRDLMLRRNSCGVSIADSQVKGVETGGGGCLGG